MYLALIYSAHLLSPHYHCCTGPWWKYQSRRQGVNVFSIISIVSHTLYFVVLPLYHGIFLCHLNPSSRSPSQVQFMHQRCSSLIVIHLFLYSSPSMFIKNKQTMSMPNSSSCNCFLPCILDWEEIFTKKENYTPLRSWAHYKPLEVVCVLVSWLLHCMSTKIEDFS